MADRFIPGMYRTLNPLKIGDPIDANFKGDNNSWETTQWYSTTQSPGPGDLVARVKAAYERAYVLEGPWAPGERAN